jgi:hypothetical protein
VSWHLILWFILFSSLVSQEAFSSTYYSHSLPTFTNPTVSLCFMKQASKNKICFSFNFSLPYVWGDNILEAHTFEHLMSNAENGTVYLLYIDDTGGKNDCILHFSSCKVRFWRSEMQSSVQRMYPVFEHMLVYLDFRLFSDCNLRYYSVLLC